MKKHKKMDRESILAHRGCFSFEEEKNSEVAFCQALNKGFGIETDLRDLDGEIVISHDPPRKVTLPTRFEWLLDQIKSSKSTGRIALNIKSDGLSTMLESKIRKFGIELDRFFVFDMSLPDSMLYLKGKIPVYSRISEYEPIPTLKHQARGIWIDNMGGTFKQIDTAEILISEGVRVVAVSPELHGRNHEEMWDQILSSKIYQNPLFQICTDFPENAAKIFCKN